MSGERKSRDRYRGIHAYPDPYCAGGAACGCAHHGLDCLRPQAPTPAKLAPYECGIVPTTPARQRFPVKFYLMAMLFIVFDIEAIFLYPWAVWLRTSRRSVSGRCSPLSVCSSWVCCISIGRESWIGLRRTSFGDSIITTTIEQVADWGRKNSIWPAMFGLACCAIEMMAPAPAAMIWPGLARGLPRLAAPGRPDDRVRPGVSKMAPVLRRVYDQMAEPKWVISMGACASCGGVHNTTR